MEPAGAMGFVDFASTISPFAHQFANAISGRFMAQIFAFGAASFFQAFFDPRDFWMNSPLNARRFIAGRTLK